jgi:hypothetical protein
VVTKEGEGAEFTIELPDEANMTYQPLFLTAHPTAKLI